jgi:hypothetical protein
MFLIDTNVISEARKGERAAAGPESSAWDGQADRRHRALAWPDCCDATHSGFLWLRSGPAESIRWELRAAGPPWRLLVRRETVSAGAPQNRCNQPRCGWPELTWTPHPAPAGAETRSADLLWHRRPASRRRQGLGSQGALWSLPEIDGGSRRPGAERRVAGWQDLSLAAALAVAVEQRQAHSAREFKAFQRVAKGACSTPFIVGSAGDGAKRNAHRWPALR